MGKSFFLPSTLGKFITSLEQGMISGLNFGSILLLSSMLSVNEFGDFIIIFSIISLTFLLSSCFISTPLMIFLPKYWNKKKHIYLINLLGINSFLTLFFFIICITSYTFFKDFHIDYRVLLLALGWSSYEVLRKFAYSFEGNNIKILRATTTLVLLFFFGLIFVYYYFNKINLQQVFLIYGGAYFIAFFVALYQIISLKDLRDSLNFDYTKEIVRRHYKFSKWLIIGSFGFWTYSQGYYLIGAEFLEDFQLGKVRVIQNILGVFSVLALAVENIYTAQASQSYLSSGNFGLQKFVRNFFKGRGFIFAFLFTSMLIVSYFVYYFMYLNKFGDGTIMIFLFGLAQILLLFIRPIIISLRVKEITKPFTGAHILSAISILTIGLLLIISLEEIGMTLGFFISTIIFCLILFISYTKYIAKNGDFDAR